MGTDTQKRPPYYVLTLCNLCKQHKAQQTEGSLLTAAYMMSATHKQSCPQYRSSSLCQHEQKLKHVQKIKTICSKDFHGTLHCQLLLRQPCQLFYMSVKHGHLL